MIRVFLIFAFSLLPAAAMAEQGQKLAMLEATLQAYYGKLLAVAQAEDAGVKSDNLPESYADQEKILKNSQSVFEDFMAKTCGTLVSSEAVDCKIKFITNRLTILGYES